jgi:hypothetical protein
MRNSVIPALNLRLEYGSKYDNGHEVLFGVAGNYKAILPRMETVAGYKTNTKATSTLLMAYFKYVVPAMTFKLGATHGQDAYNLTMIGGYAVDKINDMTTEDMDYTPYKTLAMWGDFHTNNKKWQAGLFLGYTKNLGTVETIFNGDVIVIGSPYVYARGANIDYVYRISPRVIVNAGKFRIAPEVEYTVAAYATMDDNGKYNIDSNGKISDSKEVGMVRFLLGVYYFF